MILIEENYKSNIISWIFRNQNKIDYIGAYYKNKEAQAKNRKTYFKYITSIAIKHEGGIEISGKFGTQLYIFYTVRQAIKKYNSLAKQYR